METSTTDTNITQTIDTTQSDHLPTPQPVNQGHQPGSPLISNNTEVGDAEGSKDKGQTDDRCLVNIPSIAPIPTTAPTRAEEPIGFQDTPYVRMLAKEAEGIDFLTLKIVDPEQVKRINVLKMGLWIDKGTYCVSDYPQGCINWFILRLFLLTMSNLGAALGMSTKETAFEIGMEIVGLKKRQFTEQGKLLAAHGVRTEPKARGWFCKTKNVVVKEVGLAVPKWDPRIGCSSDGDVYIKEGDKLIDTNGIIEIKCPKTMYPRLKEHMKLARRGEKFSLHYHDHIFDSHYLQMQGNMMIGGKSWCHYIVYATDDKLAYDEKIPANHEYWENFIKPGIANFFQYFVDPLLARHGFLHDISRWDGGDRGC
jgi:hypothetical protein